MKIKILLALSLAAFTCFAGCKSDANTNVMNANTMNANAVVKPTEAMKADPMDGNKIVEALKAKGFDKVTVDTTTTPATLRGTVAKGKMAEAVQVAQEAAGKPLTNQIQEDK